MYDSFIMVSVFGRHFRPRATCRLLTNKGKSKNRRHRESNQRCPGYHPGRPQGVLSPPPPHAIGAQPPSVRPLHTPPVQWIERRYDNRLEMLRNSSRCQSHVMLGRWCQTVKHFGQLRGICKADIHVSISCGMRLPEPVMNHAGATLPQGILCRGGRLRVSCSRTVALASDAHPRVALCVVTCALRSPTSQGLTFAYRL